MNQNSNKSMKKYIEISNCKYPEEATVITPCSKTPNPILYLSSLDVQMAVWPAVCLYLFKKPTSVESLKLSLSRVLVDYYPLAGRCRRSEDGRIEVDCNGKGALFAEGFLDLSANEFLEGSKWPHRSWKNLLYRVDASDFFDVPLLVIQVVHLNCGGMMLLTSLSHALCDGVGTSQFLNAWAEITRNPDSNHSITPCHSRELLKSRTTPDLKETPREYNIHYDYMDSLLSEPFVPVSVTFTPSQILRLKKQVEPSFKCTSFEVLSSHVWRSWAKSMDFPASQSVKLVFMINARNKLEPNLPKGYYGNAVVAAETTATVDKLINSNLGYGAELVHTGKGNVNDGYVRFVVDLIEAREKEPDLTATLIISQWSRLGLEDLDFGNGRAIHMGPLACNSFTCDFLPVVGDLHAFTLLMSVPEGVAEKFEYFLTAIGEENN